MHIARLANAPAALLEKGRAVAINASPARQFVAVGDTVTRRGPSDISWAGPLQDGWGWAQLVLTGKGITGWVRRDSLLFKFEPIGGGLQALIHVDESKYPPEHPAEYPSGAIVDTASARNDSGGTNMNEEDQGFNINTHQEPEPGMANIGLLVVYAGSSKRNW